MARAKNLGIIDEYQFIKLGKYTSANREEGGLGEYKGKEHSDRFMQLIYRAASEKIISLSKVVQLEAQKISRTQLIEIVGIRLQKPSLSEQDRSAFYRAQ